MYLILFIFNIYFILPRRSGCVWRSQPRAELCPCPAGPWLLPKPCSSSWGCPGDAQPQLSGFTRTLRSAVHVHLPMASSEGTGAMKNGVCVRYCNSSLISIPESQSSISHCGQGTGALHNSQVCLTDRTDY